MTHGAPTVPRGIYRDRLGITDPLFLVGGAVRDPIMGRTPGDEDYVALATPERIRAAAKRTGHTTGDLTVRDRLVGVRITGKRMPDGGVEVAPPRIEVSTGPGRHDFAIMPHPDLDTAAPAVLIVEDAARRDFTINALYADDTGHVIDPTRQGIRDARAGTLRTITPDSFRDDPLRILRGLRLVATHDVTPTADTRAQMLQYATAVTALTRKGVSGTARTELNKLLMGNHVGVALRLARDTGVLAEFLPEIARMIGFEQRSAFHAFTVDEHTIRAIEAAARLGAPLRVRLALLFHDAGKPEAAWEDDQGRLRYYGTATTPAHEVVSARLAVAVMQRLGYDLAMITDVETLVLNHMLSFTMRAKKVRVLRAKLGDAMLMDLFTHRRADILSKSDDDDPGALDALDRMQAAAVASRDRRDPVSRADLAINGRDVTALGVDGPAVGRVLHALTDEVLANPDLNTRDWLLHRARKLARRAA